MKADMKQVRHGCKVLLAWHYPLKKIGVKQCLILISMFMKIGMQSSFVYLIGATESSGDLPRWIDVRFSFDLTG